MIPITTRTTAAMLMIKGKGVFRRLRYDEMVFVIDIGAPFFYQAKLADFILPEL
jgi:hypothetical protein